MSERCLRNEPDQLFTSLITFSAIIYGFTFSLPLSKIIESVSNDVLPLFWAVPITVFFLLFLLFDWLLSSLVVLRGRFSPRFLHSYVLSVVAVPFIGISLHFLLSGYLDKSRTLAIIGFQSFFVFMVLMFAYDVMAYPKLIEQEDFLGEIPGLFHILILLKVLFTLMLLPSTFLMFTNKTDYLVKYNTILYIAYFVFKVAADYMFVPKIRSFYLKK